jgi:hypothetical protein
LKCAIQINLLSSGGREDIQIPALSWRFPENSRVSSEQTALSLPLRVASAAELVRPLWPSLSDPAKVVLMCVPEPGGEALEAAAARARGRHARVLKTAGQAMVGDSQLAMQDFGET